MHASLTSHARYAISRGLAIGVVVIIVVIVAVAGFAALSLNRTPTSSSSSTSSSLTSSASSSSTIVIGTTDSVTSLDPGVAAGIFGTTILEPNIGSTLVRYDALTNTVVPDIATNWTVSSSGLNYTFNLRQGVKFSNGDPVTAETFVQSWERVLSLQTNAFLLSPPINPNDTKALVATSNSTLQVNLEEPFAPFLTVMSVSGAGFDVVDPKVTNMTGPASGIVVGTGPYVVSTWTQGVEMDLSPNPFYYGTHPLTQNIDIKFFQDATSLALALKSGQIDIADRNLNPTDVQSFVQANSSATAPKVYESAGTTPRYIALDNAIAPFNSSIVRQALNYAINRTTIINSAFVGTVSPDYQIVPPAVNGYVPSYQKLYGSDGNMTMAKQLLTEAGYSTSNPLTFTMLYTPTHYGDTEASAATVIQQEFQSTGMIKVTLQSAEFATFLSLFLDKKNPSVPAVMLGWPPDFVDAYDYLNAIYGSQTSALNGIWYNNTQVDSLLAQSVATSNTAMRNAAFAQIQNITAAVAPIVPLWSTNYIVVASPSVTGISMNVQGVFPFGILQKAA